MSRQVPIPELMEGEPLDIVQNTTQGASLEAWRKLVRRFDPQTVGRKRTLLSRIINPGTVKVHELSRAIEQWEERVRSYQSRTREKHSDDVRSGILTEVCLEHIKTHIHLNLTRLPDYAAVRSEIETILEARQSSSNPDAMDIGSLSGQKGVCRTCGQRGHWAAECPKRGKKCQGGKGDDGKGQGKKGKSGKGKTAEGKGKGKGGKWQARKAVEGYFNHCWKWGHVEKDCFTLAKSKGKGGKGKSAGSLDEAEASGPENTSVGGFGLCSFEDPCGDWKWNDCRKVTFTLDSGAAVSAAPKSLGDDYPMQIEEPRSYMTGTGEPVQDEGFRVLPIVTEDGLHRCMNFRVALVHKALVSASKVCHKGYRIILNSEPGQSGMLHKHTNEWIGLREEKGVYVFDGWVSPVATVGRKRSKVPSLMPYEHNVMWRRWIFPGRRTVRKSARWRPADESR